MPGSVRTWTEEDGPFAVEVYAVVRKGMGALKGVTLPRLYDATSAVLGLKEPAAASVKDLAMLFEKAVSQLESNEQQAAPYLLGMNEIGGKRLDYPHGYSLPQRRELAVLAYKGGRQQGEPQPDTFRTNPEYERTMIVNIGRAIEELFEHALTGEGQVTEDDLPVDETYVRRPMLETRMRAERRQSRLTVLVGEPGVGKSTLAREFAVGSVGSESCLIVCARDYASLVLSLRAQFAKLNILSNELADGAVMFRFRQLLEGPHKSPLYVVVDNVNDWSLIEPVLPERLTVPVIITARHAPVKRRGKYIRVGSLDTHEASEMIKRRLPSLSDEQRENLTCLSGRAAAIDQVCTFLGRDGLFYPPQANDYEVFFRALKRDVLQTLDFVASGLGEEPLKAAYRHIIDDLQSRPETQHAVRLLQLISTIGCPITWGRLLYNCFQIFYDDDMLPHAFSTAVSVLRRHNIIVFPFVRSYVDPLTLAIVRDVHVLDQLSIEHIAQVVRIILDFWERECKEFELLEWLSLSFFDRSYGEMLEGIASSSMQRSSDPLFKEVLERARAGIARAEAADHAQREETRS